VLIIEKGYILKLSLPHSLIFAHQILPGGAGKSLFKKPVPDIMLSRVLCRAQTGPAQIRIIIKVELPVKIIRKRSRGFFNSECCGKTRCVCEPSYKKHYFFVHGALHISSYPLYIRSMQPLQCLPDIIEK